MFRCNNFDIYETFGRNLAAAPGLLPNGSSYHVKEPNSGGISGCTVFAVGGCSSTDTNSSCLGGFVRLKRRERGKYGDCTSAETDILSHSNILGYYKIYRLMK